MLTFRCQLRRQVCLGECQPGVNASHVWDHTCTVRVAVPLWADEGRMCTCTFSFSFPLKSAPFPALKALMSIYSAPRRPGAWSLAWPQRILTWANFQVDLTSVP